MSAPALRLRAVRKAFGGRLALDGLSFDAPAGAITGLIGPNGAGKTTCFSIVGGLLLADAGSIDVLGGGPFDPGRQRGRLGLLPQDSELPPHTRVDVLLRYLARLQGCSRRQALHEVDRVLELVELRERSSSQVRELSHGMRRRVAVAQALLGSPRLVLLDEPTSGLDPRLVAQMRDVLRRQRDRQGVSLVVSSHLLGELDAICDHVVFMEQGRCLRSGSLAEVTGRSRVLRVTLERAPDLTALRAQLPELELSCQGSLLQVRFREQSPASVNERVLGRLLEAGLGILEVRQGDSLEAAYLQSDVTDP